LIAYLSTNQLLEQLKDNPTLFVIGGIIMLAYGLISFIQLKRNFKKQTEIEQDDDNIPKKIILLYSLKGFY
jgi:hypothetical protein